MGVRVRVRVGVRFCVMYEAAWYTKAAMMPMRMAAQGWTVAQPAVMPTSAPRRELHVWPMSYRPEPPSFFGMHRLTRRPVRPPIAAERVVVTAVRAIVCA